MYLKRSFIIAFALVVIFLGSCKKGKGDKAEIKIAPSIVVDWLVAKQVRFSDNITISGTIKPAEETVLLSEISGRVTQINFKEGTFVKKGTLLVKFFDDDLQAQLQKVNAQIQLAKQTLNRQSELVKINGISQADYDQSVLQVNSLKGDLDVLKAQIRKTEIFAPYDGVLGLRNISQGAVVTPAFPLTTIRDIQELKLDFSVPEKYSSDVRNGFKIKFTVNGNDEEYQAVVIATELGVDVSTRNMKARAIINKLNSKFIPGAYTTIYLPISENKKAIIIPSQAIIPQEKGKKVIISVNGKAKFVDVKTGLRQTSGIEILDGISENDTVITTGVMFIKPNAPLKLKIKKDQNKIALEDEESVKNTKTHKGENSNKHTL